MTVRTKSISPLAVISGVVVILFAAMAVDTKFVRIGSPGAARRGAFSPLEYGASEFPKVQSDVEARAVDAATLAAGLAKDQATATKQYGVAALGGPEFSVRFTGTAGKQDFGTYDVAVPGVPNTVHVTMQTGPAIMGDDLRDATGKIKFGHFENQIVYQNAGSALNTAMKKQVLAKVDTGKLTGKTVSVVGVFQLADPTTWLVTPVKLAVK